MRDLFNALPGPPFVKAVLAALIVVVVLALLVVVFEYGGDLIDDGGTIG
ncbi:MAG: hypothetical protein JSV07_00795 [Acidimicrobiia bacterium]|nr:MAG: hypothetical protein JSV07_00795 [Acidimicrobiia bacterium]